MESSELPGRIQSAGSKDPFGIGDEMASTKPMKTKTISERRPMIPREKGWMKASTPVTGRTRKVSAASSETLRRRSVPSCGFFLSAVPDADGIVNGVVLDTTDDGDFINVIADIPVAGARLFGRLQANP